MEQQPPPPNESPRKGSARERQQRRRERKQHVFQPKSSSRGAPRQIRPSGGFKLPKFRLPFGRTLLYAIGGALFLVAVIVALGLFKNRGPQIAPNALWVGTEWTYESQADEDVLAFSQRLRDNRIGTVYAWVSWLKADGTWAGRRDGTNEFSEVQDDVKNFVRQFKLVYPDGKIYGWVSVPTDTLGIDPRLGDATVQQTIADFSKTVVDDLGFDGVFLNVEQVWEGDNDYLGVLRKVRAAIGEDKPISAAVPPDWSPTGVDIPVSPNILPGTAWSKEYKQSVALLTDQMVVMAYNSGLTTAADYVTWMAYQVQSFAAAIGELGTTTRLEIGVPTYAAEPPAHDPAVENIASALDGIRLGLERAGNAASYVEGVAIYADWETDDTEWSQFKAGWVDR